MALTPDQVRAQVFTPVRHGYDEFEVDAFLDSVVDSLSELATEVAELTAKLSPPSSTDESTKQASSGVSHSAAHLLVVAQATADDCVAAGRAEAATMVRRARQEAEEIRRSAAMSAAELVEQAETKRRESLGQLLYEQQRLQEAISAALLSREQVRADLEDYLRTLLARIAGPGTDGSSLGTVRALRA